MGHEKALEILARSGYAARGVVYVIIGYFTLLAAVGAGGTTDSEGALRSLLGQPFGTVLVALMVVGLLGHSGWRFAQSIFDKDDHGGTLKGVAVRIGLFASALTHLALAGFAASLLVGARIGGGDRSGEWLAVAVSANWGPVLTWSLAFVLLGVGAALVVKGARAGFEKHFRCESGMMDRLRPICRVGLVARGAVFMVMGVLATYANIIYSPEDAPGLGDALEAIGAMPAGSVLLAAMGAGLVAFAVYSFAAALYRHIEIA